jgi:hypothetical protein
VAQKFSIENKLEEFIMFCGSCGAKIEDSMKFCSNCGGVVTQTSQNITEEGNRLEKQKVAVKPNDAPSLGFAILSCCLPIIGLILFIVWIKSRPQKAKSCGKGTIVGLIIGVAFTIFKEILIQPSNGGIVSFNEGKEFYFEGLTISYPNDWRVESEIVMEDIVFFVNCDKPNPASSDQVSITWLRNTENSTEEMVERVIGEYKAIFNQTEFTSLYTSTFKGLKCISTDFTFDEQLYGNITSFIMNENTVIIVKLSDSKGKLSDENFRLIEESSVVR